MQPDVFFFMTCNGFLRKYFFLVEFTVLLEFIFRPKVKALTFLNVMETVAQIAVVLGLKPSYNLQKNC